MNASLETQMRIYAHCLPGWPCSLLLALPNSTHDREGIRPSSQSHTAGLHGVLCWELLSEGSRRQSSGVALVT